MRLSWSLDDAAVEVAHGWNPLRSFRRPARQFEGESGWTASWQDWLGRRALPTFVFCDENEERFSPSPTNIMRAFSEGEYMAGAIMVLAWGGMERQKQRLLAPGHRRIERAVQLAAQSIVADRSVDRAWAQLQALGWSSVATSKCLHFMSRGLGVERNPPVAIDNAAIRNTVYPRFRAAARKAGITPTSWRVPTWEAYVSYMSAITVWALQKGWTTTDVETTLFRDYWETAR